MNKILGFALSIMMVSISSNTALADYVKDFKLIEKYQVELDAGNLNPALKYTNQVSAGAVKDSMFVHIFMKVIEMKKCLFAKPILDKYEDKSGFGIKKSMELQYQTNC